MGLFIKQDESRSQLQQKIAADIAERQRANAKADGPPPDGVADSRLIEGTAHASRVGIIVLVGIVAVIVGVVIFVSVR